jgi:glycosyltransferase involved in cell wall biosynthesis
MRIVHVVHGLGMGGQERLIVHLSREFAARGHEPVIVTLSPGGELLQDLQDERDVPVYVAVRRTPTRAEVAFRLASLLRSLRADVLHTHNPAPLLHAVPAAFVARVRRRVHTKHGANAYGVRGLWAARALVRTLDAVVAVSPQTADIARIKEKVPERRLHVVPNGIPLRQFRPDPGARARVRHELGIPADAFVVGSVGRLAREKEYPRLVEALLPSLSARFRLVLVGEGDARPEIERAIPARASPFVTLTGTRRDVPALLSAFDLFALSSRTEGLPLAVPEAMACELPVVATSVGGLPSIVSRASGVLVPPGDGAALRLAIEDLARDRSRARAMGAAARREAIASFAVERTADAYEDLYRGA